MAKKAVITAHPKYTIGEISPMLYSAYLEPIGTQMNGCMFNPGHETADEMGLRHDFIDALKSANVPAIRLPGGNFVSGWEWKDSVGPRSERKAHLDLAWKQIYTNEVGHDEFLTWAELCGMEPLYTMNLGTGDLKDIIHMIEYSNFKGGTYWSDLRRQNGREEPYAVKRWYLGNEMDGPWQIGTWERDPRGYGRMAREASKVMKLVDNSVETIACVSCSPFLPHYPQWDMEVLEECYEVVDYISMHHYHTANGQDMASLMAAGEYYENYIKTEIALCDFMQAKLASPKKMMLSIDEYGSHFGSTNSMTYQPLSHGRDAHKLAGAYFNYKRYPDYVKHDPSNMQFGKPRGGDILNALTSGSTILSFLRHADRVKIGCMTGGLAAYAAADNEHVWRAAVYYVMQDLLTYGRGTSLQLSVDCDTYDVPSYAIDDVQAYAELEGVKYIDAAAALDEENGCFTVFVVNRNWEENNALELDLSAFEGYEFVEHSQLYSEDLNANNSYENPNVIVPSVNHNAKFENGTLIAEVKKLSWNVFKFRKG